MRIRISTFHSNQKNYFKKNMRDIATLFRSLGFSDGEMKTYLTVLELGPSTVIDITKKTKLSRQTVYNAIETLIDKGLMSTVMKGKKRCYISEDPERLHAYLKRKEIEFHEKAADIQRSMPELRLIQGGERPVVKMIEGKEGVIGTYSEMEFNKKDTVYYEISDLDAAFSVIKPEEVKQTYADMKKTNIVIKGMYAGTPLGKTLKSHRYFLPKDQSNFNSSISVYGDKIDITTFEGKMYTILIENKTLAQTFRILFERAIKGCADLPHD